MFPLFLIIFLANLKFGFPKYTVQKGGILFEDIGAAQINGETMTYKRVADTSVLETATQTSSDLTTIYSVMCQGVQAELKRAREDQIWIKTTGIAKPEQLQHKWEIFITPIKYPLKEAERICTTLNARQPEIHTVDDYTRIQNIALKNNIQYIKAGIDFQQSTRTYRFKSTGEPAKNSAVFSKLRYGGEWPNHDHEADFDEPRWVLPLAPKFFLAYKNPGKNFHVRMVTHGEMYSENLIICEREVEERKINTLQDNMLFQMIAHNCRRDREAAINIMAATIAEARAVTNLRIVVNDTEPNYQKFFPKMTEFQDIENVFNNNKEKENVRERRSHSQIIDQSSVENRQNESLTSEENESSEEKETVKNGSEETQLEEKQTVSNGSIIINDPNNINGNNTYTEEIIQKGTMQNHARSKRFAWMPVLAGVTTLIAGANVISSSTNGDAPLSWFGGGFGKVLGLATTRDPALATALSQIATEITQLKQNDEKIVKSFNSMVEKAVKFEKKFVHNAQAMALMVMERDLFQTIKYVCQVLQSTVQKYAQILASAAVGKTSPYALTIAEVGTLSKILFASRGFLLDENINNIKSIATIENNQLVLIFQIPILDDQKRYHFHRPLPIPIFTGDEVHIPLLDTDSIAISKSGSRYVPISSQEYTQCMQQPQQCVIHQPSRPSHDAFSCTITSYIKDEIACPIKKISSSTPMFYYLDNDIMYYSTKNNTKLFVKCETHRHRNEYAEEVMQLSGQGKVKLRPSCTITTPDGSTMKTGAPEEIVNLTATPIFEMLKYFPQPTGYEIKNEDLNNTIFHITEKIVLPEEDLSVPSLTDILKNAFQPKKGLTFIVSAVMLAALVLSLIVMAYCCRYKGMACLRLMHITSSKKTDDSETPVDIEERKMRNRLQQMQMDIYDIQERVRHPHAYKRRHQRSKSMNSLDEINKFANEHIYATMKRRPAKVEIHSNEDLEINENYPERFPTILRKQLAEAEKAYQLQN